MGRLASEPLPYGGFPKLHSGGQNEKWPTSGRIGYMPPAAWGFPKLHTGGQNEKWPTSGRMGYMPQAVGVGVPNASYRGTK